MSKAISWLEKAAKQGDPASANALFSFYSSGTDIPKDYTKAYGYLKIIEKNIGEENKAKIQPQLEKLMKELSPTQLAEAESFANNWLPQKTRLTIKALAGKKESWHIVNSTNKK